MSPPARSEQLRAGVLVRPYALMFLYRRRLRVHLAQELFAGIGVAVAVALVSAAMIANNSIEGSGSQVVRAVIGPATLQLRARDAAGLPERLLAPVEHLPGVVQAAPLLEQSVTILTPGGRPVLIDLAGTDASLAQLNGLDRLLPVGAFTPGGIGLSTATARELGIAPASAVGSDVTVELDGARDRLQVVALLGPEAAGALSQARVAVMPLSQLQRIAGLSGRLTGILVSTRPRQTASVRTALGKLAGGRLMVAAADADIAQLHQALRPSNQASGFFAAISAMLGFLFAFNAMLLTVPERRAAIADLRLIGTRRAAVVQIVAFQALCLGVAASVVGLLGGYALALGAFHQSAGYLAEAFTIGTNTVVGVEALLVSLGAGLIATLLASAVPLLDLRRGQAIDAVYFEDGAPGNALGGGGQLRLGIAAAGLLGLATALFELSASLAFIASGVLALATVLAVPLVFAGVLRLGAAVADRFQRLTVLQVALTSLRAATLRSLALAATGAVAIFGGIALGGSRGDLLRGIDRFSHDYAADAELWVGNPGDNQATVPFAPDRYASRIARLPGVAGVSTFQGSFLELGDRRAWVIARPPGANRNVLTSQIVDGNASAAIRHLGEGGWIAVSQQIADEHHVRLGETFRLPTPAGEVPFRLAATTTNLAWSPGVIFMGTRDYSRWWDTTLPTALGVRLAPGASASRVRGAIAGLLGSAGGLEVTTAGTREARIDALTKEGLSRLGEISALLVVAAILAMATAIGSSMWQRRRSLAGLRLAGVSPRRLRRVLLTEAALMLSAGCITGAIAGVYGEVIIDGYLEHVTGFPVAGVAVSGHPFEILALVIALALLFVTVPGWVAARVSPTLALDD
jgi:putative ABC transport system permease protein